VEEHEGLDNSAPNSGAFCTEITSYQPIQNI